MNFVKAETLVQEITADGKVRDIVTERVKTAAEKEAERKEDIIRNLPEFKRERQEAAGGPAKSLKEQLAEREQEEEETRDAEKGKYGIAVLDEDEYEHYQKLESTERDQKRQRSVQELSEVALFESDRKRLKGDVGGDGGDAFQKSLQKRKDEKAKQAVKQPSAQDRLKGRIVVRAKASEQAAAPPAAAASEEDEGGGLVGYGSDSDS